MLRPALEDKERGQAVPEVLAKLKGSRPADSTISLTGSVHLQHDLDEGIQSSFLDALSVFCYPECHLAVCNGRTASNRIGNDVCDKAVET